MERIKSNTNNCHSWINTIQTDHLNLFDQLLLVCSCLSQSLNKIHTKKKKKIPKVVLYATKQFTLLIFFYQYNAHNKYLVYTLTLCCRLSNKLYLSVIPSIYQKSNFFRLLIIMARCLSWLEHLTPWMS